ILWNLPTLCSRAVGCSPNRRKVSVRRGAAYDTTTPEQCNVCVCLHLQKLLKSPPQKERDTKILKKRKSLFFLKKRPINWTSTIDHEKNNILYQEDMGLYDGLVGIMLSNE
ncbi:hypothetical protein AVEN_90104-1, partial [Araneus ventricosus]